MSNSTPALADGTALKALVIGQTGPADFSDPAHDKLSGIRQIAKFINESERRTTYLLENGQIPAGKLGKRWIASRARLRRFFSELAQ
jgi:hypothetical protein